MKKALILIYLSLWLTENVLGQENHLGCTMYLKSCDDEYLSGAKFFTMKNGAVEVTCTGRDDTSFSVKYYAIMCDGKLLKHGDYFGFTRGKKTSQALFIRDSLRSLTFFYPDETITYAIKNEKLNGAFHSYYNGFAVDHLKAYGHFNENAKVGVWQSHYSNGNKRDSGSYSGEYVRIVYDTLLKCAIFFNASCIEINRECSPQKLKSLLLEGYQIDLNEVSFPLIISKKTGIWKYYDENGRMKQTIDYNKENLKRYVVD
jgi:hypothetical protein